jgi:polysaccharide chain length determinant protein (PEP-CTERM system associated)
MLGHRELVVDDYIEILRRRRWVILLPLVIAPLIAFITMKIVPPRYVSTTLILIEQKSVPDDYVKPVVTEDLNSRLASLREQIYSRSRLLPIMERFQLYSNQSIGLDDRLDLMRKSIELKAIKSDLVTRMQGMPGFTISFSADQPQIARDVCGEITSLFISENLRLRQNSVQGTTDFIRSQLDEAKRNLDQQDARLAAFERSHFGEMPNQEQSNMSMLSTMTAQLEASTQALNQLQQNRVYLDATMAQAVQQQQQVDVSSPTSSQTPSSMQAQLQKLVAEEQDLESRYTPDFPDLARVRRDIEALKKKISDTEKGASAPAAANAAVTTKPSLQDTPQLAQMKAQLHLLNRQIEDKRAEQERLRERLAQVQSRVQSSPAVQEQLKQLTRDYQTALQFYNDLLAKKNRSEMAGDLERKQQGQQLRVMDPPNLPDKPAFPNPVIFMGGGVGAGIFLGVALAALLEYRDRTLRNERDVFSFTKLPTLGTIPLSAGMTTPRRLPWRRDRKHYVSVQG